MKRTIFTTLMIFSFCYSQSQNVSYLYLNPENVQSVQTNVIRQFNNKIFVLNLSQEINANWEVKNIPYLDQYNLSGDFLERNTIISSESELIQSFSQKSFEIFGNNILFSADKFYLGDTLQNTFIQSFNELGQPDWKIDFASIDSFSSSGLFIKLEANLCLHGMVREAESDETISYLSMMKFDTLGQALWQKSTQLPDLGNGFYSRLSSVASTNNRLIWLLGYLSFTNGSQSVIIETDFQGNIINMNQIPESEGLMQFVNDEQYFYTIKNNLNSQNTLSFCLSQKEGAFSSENWEYCSLDEDFNTEVWASNVDMEGNVFIVGRVLNLDFSNQFGFIAKISANGNVIWNKKYTFLSSNDLHTVIRSIDFLPDGRISTIGNHLNQSGFHQWLMILDENGCYNGDCSELINVEQVVGTSVVKKKIFFNVYPNPADKFLIVSFDMLNESSSTEYFITNSIGQIIERKKIFVQQSRELIINIENYSNGVYFLTCINDKGTKKSISFLKI